MADQMTSAASLRTIGDHLVPEEITRVLGYAPTKGEFEAADRAPDDLNGQIMEIVGRLNPDLDVWASLANRFRMDLFCGLFMAKSDEGFILSPKALLALASRRIELGICLYGPITPPRASAPRADRG